MDDQQAAPEVTSAGAMDCLLAGSQWQAAWPSCVIMRQSLQAGVLNHGHFTYSARQLIEAVYSQDAQNPHRSTLMSQSRYYTSIFQARWCVVYTGCVPLKRTGSGFEDPAGLATASVVCQPALLTVKF